MNVSASVSCACPKGPECELDRNASIRVSASVVEHNASLSVCSSMSASISVSVSVIVSMSMSSA